MSEYLITAKMEYSTRGIANTENEVFGRLKTFNMDGIDRESHYDLIRGAETTEELPEDFPFGLCDEQPLATIELIESAYNDLKNNLSVPHIGKLRGDEKCALITQIKCDDSVTKDVMEYLEEILRENCIRYAFINLNMLVYDSERAMAKILRFGGYKPVSGYKHFLLKE